MSAEAKASANTKIVTLTFSEPVDPATGIYKVNGKVASVVAGSTPNTLKVTSVDSLQAGSSYSVEILNAKDFAGNIMKPTTTTVNVVKDAVGAKITSLTTVGDNKVRVTFDKSMDELTVINANIIVIKSDGTPVAISDYGVAAVNNTNKKTFDITFTTGLYVGVNTEALTLVFNNNIKDSVGNTIETVTKSATLNKDVVAPMAQSVKVLPKNETYDGVPYADGAFVVTFNEDVVAPAVGAIGAGTIKVIDQDGTDISTNIDYSTSSAPVLNSKNSKILVIPFESTTAIPTTAKKATVKIPAGITQDDSLGSNDNVAATFNNVDLNASLSDTTKPIVKTVAGGANNTITFTIEETNLDKTTVQAINSYRLDGKPLATGSYVTIDSVSSAPDHDVTVHLADGSVDKTQDYAFTIAGIKDKSGNVANTVGVNNVSLVDDVKPVLESSKINSDNTFTLKFSEEVTGLLAADLEIFVNNKVVAIDNTQYTLTPITAGAEKGSVLVTLNLVFEDTDTTASNGDEKLFIDINGNGTYDPAVDILLLEGTFADDVAATAAYGTNTTDMKVDLSDLTSIKVKMIDGTPTGADSTGNVIESKTLITVK